MKIGSMTVQDEQIARIERSQNEARRFCAETRPRLLVACHHRHARWRGAVRRRRSVYKLEPGALSMYSGTWRSARF
jgi:hypothetical protein